MIINSFVAEGFQPEVETKINTLGKRGVIEATSDLVEDFEREIRETEEAGDVKDLGEELACERKGQAASEDG